MRRRNILTRATALVMAVGMLADSHLVMAAETTPVSDTEENSVIEIHSVEGLERISENLDGDYILMRDLDLSFENWRSIGTNTEPFTGTFDGNGYTIKGMSITEDSDDDNFLGLFGVIKEASIRNLTLEESSITVSETDPLYAGLITGKMQNSVLDDCYAAGTITLNDDAPYCAGGIAGIVVQYIDRTADYSYNMNNCITDVEFSSESQNGTFDSVAGHVEDTALVQNSYSVEDAENADASSADIVLTSEQSISNASFAAALENTKYSTALLSQEAVDVSASGNEETASDSKSVESEENTQSEVPEENLQDTEENSEEVYDDANASDDSSETIEENAEESESPIAEETEEIQTDEEEIEEDTFEDEGTSGDYTYTVSGTNATITKYNGAGGALVIPETIDGYTVTVIDSSAFAGSAVTKVSIPKTIKTIGNSAFKNCTSLTSVTMNYNDATEDTTSSGTQAYAATIGYEAFSGCTSLITLTLSENVTTLGYYMIVNTAISSITIPKSVTGCDYYGSYNGPLSGAANLKEVIFEEGTTTIPAYICSTSSYSSYITSVVMPESVTSIGTRAFSNCENLKLNELPSKLTTISSYAFARCKNLAVELNLPKTIKTIGSDAFYGCTSLTSVTMNYNDATEDTTSSGTQAYKATIGSEAFEDCTSLTTLNLSENVTTLGYYMIANTAISSITIPKSVTGCEYYGSYNGPLSGATKLKEVIFEGGTTTIPAYVCSTSSFSSYITKVIIPDSVTSIGNRAFYNCDNITIYGYEGSYAEIYAAANNIPFVSVAVSKNATAKEIVDDMHLGTLVNDVDLSDVEITGPTVNLRGKDIPLFTLDAGLNLKIGDNLQAKVDQENKTVQVLIGFNDFEGSLNLYDEANSSAYWEESYAQIKSLYKSVNSSGSTKNLYNGFRALKKNLRAKNMKLGISASGSVAGYIEFSYATGELSYKEGGVILEAGIDSRLDYPLPVINAFYVTFGLGADFKGSLKLIKEAEYSYTPSLDASLDVNATLGAGIGNYRANVYGEVRLKGNINFGIQLPESSLENALNVTLTGYASAEYNVLGLFSDSYGPVEFARMQLYPKSSSKAKALFNGEDLLEIDTEDFETVERTYLSDSSAAAIETADSEESTDLLYTMNNIYPYSDPQLVNFSDGTKLLVWVGDNGTKSDINKTSLMYMTYDGSSWSDAAEIAETGGANDYPSVYSDGTKAYIIWQKASALNDGAGLTELLEAMDLYMVTFENGVMGDAQSITSNNSTYEMMQCIAVNGNTVASAWIENAENDPFQTEGGQSIKCAVLSNGTWKTSTVASGLDYITSLSIEYYNGTQIITYETNDEKIHLLQNGSEQVISGTNPQIVSGILYYTDDNGLNSYDLSSRTQTLVISGLQDRVTILDDGTHRAAVAVEANGFASRLIAFTYDKTTGSWSDAVTLIDDGTYIRSYSASLDSIGQVTAAANLVEVLDDDDIEDTVNGAASLKVYGFESKADITMNEGISYDSSLVAAGGNLPVYFDVTNSGMSTVNSLNISVTDANGAVIQEETVECAIEPGKTQEVSFVLAVPDPLEKQTFTLSASAEGEADETDNSQTFVLGYADLAITNLYLTSDSSSTLLKGTVVNNGYDTAEDVLVTVFSQDESGDVIGTYSVKNLAAQASKEFSLVIVEDYLDVNPLASGNIIYALASTSSDEENYADNSAVYLIQSSTDEPLVLSSRKLQLKPGDTAEVPAVYSSLTTVDESAVQWTSADESVAVVEDGTVTAVSVGETVLTAKYNGYKAEFSVVVSETIAVEAVVLSSNSVTVAAGSTKQLTASILPTAATNQKVTWTSEDTDVVTVSSTGLLTGVAAGSTTVTAVTDDGSKTAECKVIVSRTIQSSYKASFRGGDGSSGVRPKSISAAPESTITLPDNTFTNEGYEFAGWSDGTNTYAAGASYRMPYSNVTFTAQWKEKTVVTNPFTDVKENNYFYDAVLWAVDKGITGGTTATTFSPNQECTRQQVVMFLWRYAGKPEPETTTNPFTDVKSSSSFYKAIMWAVETGITSGSTKTTFSPNATCTRQQIAMFLWRYAGKPAHSVTKNPFTDVNSSGTYYNAIMWAVEKGITSGKTAATFVPTQECTRAQIVTFLYRMNNIS